jgi:hypothetical protein
MKVTLCVLLVLIPIGSARGSVKCTQSAARIESPKALSWDCGPAEQSLTQKTTRFQNKLYSRKAFTHSGGVLFRVRGGDSNFDSSMSSNTAQTFQPKLHLAGKLLPALKDTLKLGPNAGAAMSGIFNAALFSVRSSNYQNAPKTYAFNQL